MESFIKFIENIHPLSSDSLKALMGLTNIVSYKSGDHLVKIGEINTKLFFVLEGGLRLYTKGNKGNDINISITFEGTISAPLKSAVFKEPSDTGCQALMDCVVLEAPVKKLEELRAINSDFSEFMFKTIELEQIKLMQSYTELLSKDATERYLILRTKVKNIDQLIPQYQIASHLGITPIQLSRIRKKLFNQSSK